MKKISCIFLLATLISCRNDDAETTQTIDQTMHLYIKSSSGQDLLNSKISGSYKTVVLTDVGGAKDKVISGSFSYKKDADTLNYMEYTSGATRLLADSISPREKIYESKIEVALNKTSVTSGIERDTMLILYNWTPQKFEVGKVKYKGSTVFTKTQGAANTVTVVK